MTLKQLVSAVCILAVLVGCQRPTISLRPEDVMYILRYDRNDRETVIDQYSVTSDEKIRSFKADDNITYLTKLPNGKIWLTYHQNFEGRFQFVKELDPVTGKIRKILDYPSISASEVLDLGDKFYIRVEYIHATDEYIKNNPDLVDHNYSGFEVYTTSDRGPQLNSFIRLEMDSFITDVSMSEDRKFLYTSVNPIFLSPVGTPPGKGLLNGNQYSWIGEINTASDKIERMIPLHPYLRGMWGIEVVGDYIYVTALEKETFTSDVGTDRVNITDPMMNDKKPYVPTYSEEIRDYNKSLFVFSRNPFKLVKKIPIEAMGRRMTVDRDNKRLFVLHEGGIGSGPIGLISVIDLETHTRIAQLNVPRIRVISYAGHHRLYVTTATHLMILDTRTLEIIKKIPGEFGMIAGQW